MVSYDTSRRFGTMNNMHNAFFTKPLVLYLVAAMLSLSTFAGPADAMFISAAPHQDGISDGSAPSGRTADLARIRTALESKVVSQRLVDYGLSPSETMNRINNLSDDQIHQLASHTDSLQAGGDAVGFVVGVMIVALLAVLLIFLVQGRIVIK
jgi:hypothetical protein